VGRIDIVETNRRKPRAIDHQALKVMAIGLDNGDSKGGMGMSNVEPDPPKSHMYFQKFDPMQLTDKKPLKLTH
jgi:hypothetical protein